MSFKISARWPGLPTTQESQRSRGLLQGGGGSDALAGELGTSVLQSGIEENSTQQPMFPAKPIRESAALRRTCAWRFYLNVYSCCRCTAAAVRLYADTHFLSGLGCKGGYFPAQCIGNLKRKKGNSFLCSIKTWRCRTCDGH